MFSPIEPNEAVTLLVTLMALPIVVTACRRIGMTTGRRLFILAYCLVIVGQVATILEGYTLPELFNTLEHFSYSASGIVFAFAIWLQTTREIGRAR